VFCKVRLFVKIYYKYKNKELLKITSINYLTDLKYLKNAKKYLTRIDINLIFLLSLKNSFENFEMINKKNEQIKNR